MIRKLLETCPQLCLKDSLELEQKYEYIHIYMAFEPDELITSLKWMDLSLDEIQDRHKFLQKTERYITPNPKRPQISKENLSAADIFDTSDRELAKLAGVYLDEWTMFRQLCERERFQSDQTESFERIKPTHIRTFERRLKERREKLEGELE